MAGVYEISEIATYKRIIDKIDWTMLVQKAVVYRARDKILNAERVGERQRKNESKRWTYIELLKIERNRVKNN